MPNECSAWDGKAAQVHGARWGGFSSVKRRGIKVLHQLTRDEKTFGMPSG